MQLLSHIWYSALAGALWPQSRHQGCEGSFDGSRIGVKANSYNASRHAPFQSRADRSGLTSADVTGNSEDQLVGIVLYSAPYVKTHIKIHGTPATAYLGTLLKR